AGTAAAASSLFTVTQTISEPASARAATCSMVPATSAVSVLVIDCTTTGTSQPTRTCPILTVGVFLRRISAIHPVYLQASFRQGGIAGRESGPKVVELRFTGMR